MFAFLMGVKSVSPATLQALLRARGAVAIDVNSRQSWQKAHVPGAANLDHATFGAADLPADKAALLVFYCSNPMCRKAPLAARRARQMGYADARVMSAGISGWIDGGLPTEGG